jgi:phosphatidylinositol glycan class A protein
VVSTKVGGIPEVLPSELLWLTDPSVKGLLKGLERALADRKTGNVISPFEAHAKVKDYYQWDDIAKRTQKVYDSVINDPVEDLGERLHKFWLCGTISGALFIVIAVVEHFLSLLFSWLVPIDSIDIAPELTIKNFSNDSENIENGFSYEDGDMLNVNHNILSNNVNTNRLNNITHN